MVLMDYHLMPSVRDVQANRSKTLLGCKPSSVTNPGDSFAKGGRY